MTQGAMKGAEKDMMTGMTRGDFIELDPATTSITLPNVRIDGPYGAPAEDVFKSQVAILVGAGIGKISPCINVVCIVKFLSLGVTPFASILKHIWYRQKKGNLGCLRRVEFFWICRDSPSFGWFQSLLQEVENAQADRKSDFFLYSRIPHISYEQPTSYVSISI